MFYITPPKGFANLEILRTYLMVRWEFILSLLTDCEVSRSVACIRYYDCLIEGTVKDSLSHFLLRLICYKSEKLRKTFVEAECHLFACRIKTLTSRQEILSIFFSLLRKLERASAKGRLTRVLQHMHTFVKQVVFDQTVMSSQEWFANLQVPFELIPELVSERAVVLDCGMAELDVQDAHMLHRLLQCLFKRTLQEQDHAHVTVDDRIIAFKPLLEIILKKYSKSAPDIQHKPIVVRKDDLNSVADDFPLCMRTIHHSLRTRHRVPHSARLQYTLFLKELGLPLEDALDFWMEEYSKSTTGHCGCEHSWQKDSKRYTYSIRHLYGLEGGRKSYRAHSCSHLQESSNPGLCGGCPFNNYDEQNLSALLKSCSENERVNIVDCAKSGNYNRACRTLFQVETTAMRGSTESPSSEDASIEFERPEQYFVASYLSRKAKGSSS